MEGEHNVKDFNSIKQKRQSIYPYQIQQGRHIHDETIWQILEIANRANTRTAAFLLFDHSQDSWRKIVAALKSKKIYPINSN